MQMSVLHSRSRRGAAAVLAMLFLTIFVTLALAMYSSATLNVQSAHNLSDLDRARGAAESGLRWMQFRFIKMNRPRTTIGNIDATAANGLWPALTASIQSDFNSLLTPAERTLTVSGKSITSNPVRLDDSSATFSVHIQQHPFNLSDPLDARYVRVTSTGTYRGATRSVSMDFKIDKKVKFAVVGKVPIQLGRNTIVEGPVAMATASKYPPILQLSDFSHLDSALTTKMNQWTAFLKANHGGYDNRVSVNDTDEYNLALANGFDDHNADGYLDDYDLFLNRFDSNGDTAISAAEFTNPSTGQLYDPNLFSAIDSLGGPLTDGEPLRDGYQDGVIDNRDAYAKVEGQLVIATSASAWTSNLAGQGKVIQDMIQGSINPTDPTAVPVKFGANANDIFDLSPANFEECADGFKARSGTAAGTTSVSGSLIANTTLTAAHANAAAITERTPLGSVSYQATYRRPVYQNMTLRNVIVPKGLNPLFNNCTFEGVTFIEGERDIKTSGGSTTTSSSEGMNWSKRRISGDSTFSNTKVLIGSGTPTSGQMITHGSQKGNNIRFNNCTFKGPLAGNYSTAYTHFANSWEFTGATLFDNQADDTATIVSPQVNIEMGSFTNPTAAPSTLVGVVVAGNIDIRGTSIVDGSIIVTGDGAGNTTLGYFGPSDGDTNPSAMPEGGYGKLIVRYNPNRALPDGINIPIDVLADVTTYREGF
ncbi:MAG TPA: pilus assembly PilX N-terminal domain-containing protein [Tepidisphaeraceae bacterium]|mgnify:CR=1 FL=1|nr:pilus assembly PilX N-terminal domain-containing protein [Tepidisphaeraceae bacterium]